MNAHAFDLQTFTGPRTSTLADFLFQGLKRSGCLHDRARAYQWLILRTRDTQELTACLDALFPNA